MSEATHRRINVCKDIVGQHCESEIPLDVLSLWQGYHRPVRRFGGLPNPWTLEGNGVAAFDRECILIYGGNFHLEDRPHVLNSWRVIFSLPNLVQQWSTSDGMDSMRILWLQPGAVMVTLSTRCNFGPGCMFLTSIQASPELLNWWVLKASGAWPFTSVYPVQNQLVLQILIPVRHRTKLRIRQCLSDGGTCARTSRTIRSLSLMEVAVCAPVVLKTVCSAVEAFPGIDPRPEAKDALQFAPTHTPLPKNRHVALALELARNNQEAFQVYRK